MNAASDMALERDDVELLESCMSPSLAIRTLLDAGRPQAALRLQLRLMPRGYVVPWVCQCASETVLSPQDREGVALADAWSRAHDEPHRRAAMAHAERLRYAGAGALVAACAGWSSGVLLNAGGEVVGDVGEHMMAVAAAGALLSLAAMSADMAAECHRLVESALPFMSPDARS